MTTALVALAPVRRESRSTPALARANADFIAHLIATAGHAPQTRERRRAGPQEAVAAYSALGHWPTPPGRTLSRSL